MARISTPTVETAKFYKQTRYLLKDIRHSSLRAKKYDEAHDIWQARLNGGYRFYFILQMRFCA